MTWKVLRNKRNGSIHTGYEPPSYDQPLFDETDPFVFEDSIRFNFIERGRRAVIVNLTGLHQEWRTGLDGLSQMIPLMVNGVVTGKFCFKKQGTQIYVYPAN